MLALPLLASPPLLTSPFVSIFPCRCQCFSCTEVGHAKNFNNSLKQVSERQVCCWKPLNFHCSWQKTSGSPVWQVDGTASERWRKSAEWREVDRFSQRHFSEWRDLDRLSASNRLNILSVGSSIYTELPDRKETGLAEIKPERVDWESVRSALAEQLRYNLRSPHNYPQTRDGQTEQLLNVQNNIWQYTITQK